MKRFFLIFSKRLHFIANRKSINSSKEGTRDFQNSTLFVDRHIFMQQSLEISNVFSGVTLKKNSRRTFFKLRVLRLKTHDFHKKIALSKALPNVKTNRIGSTKSTYLKERSFASNFFFWKFCFSLRTFYKELIWCTN